MRFLKSFLLIFFICVFTKQTAVAQNYFYTNIKVPFLEYLAYTSKQTNNDPNNTTAGLFLNAGYSVKLMPNFYTEIGIDYLVVNSVNNKFYSGSNFTNPKAQFEAKNSALAIQVKPLYKLSIDSDDATFLTFGTGINYQKLFSSGTFTKFNDTGVDNVEVMKTESRFHTTLQPEITIIFKTAKQIGYRFGLSYSYINWDKNTEKFVFDNNKNFNIPSNINSNLLLSAGFIF